MDDFKQIIGKRIIEIYLEPTAVESGIADTQIHADFIYVGSGSIFLRTDSNLYLMGSLHSTKLATSYLGIKERNVFLPNSSTWPKTINELNIFKDSIVRSIQLYWDKENWPNYQHNEQYLKSLTIQFDNELSLSLFAGVYEMNEAIEKIIFLPGYTSTILFTSQEVFEKHELNQAFQIDNF